MAMQPGQGRGAAPLRPYLPGTHGTLVDPEIQPQPTSPGRQGDRRDHREPVMSLPTVLDGGLPARRPGAAHPRVKPEAASVQKDDAPPILAGFLGLRPALAPPAPDGCFLAFPSPLLRFLGAPAQVS